MKIDDGYVVEIDYTLRGDDGEVIDTSEGDEPLTYLHGVGQIVPGLEKALLGKVVGDAVKATVSAEEGYGTWDAQQVMTVHRKRLPPDAEPAAGMQLAGMGPAGEPILLHIVKVEGDMVTLDANHPLAGKTLHFDVQVRTIRDVVRGTRAPGACRVRASAHRLSFRRPCRGLSMRALG
jgi:FKBP-type peptidyl-prolyl cis-trans isomerase SlyD